MGAAIATVLAELVACVMQFYSLRGRELGIANMLKKTAIYLIVGLLMIFIVRVAALLPVRNIIKIAIEIFVGAAFFGGVCLLYWIKTNNRFYEILCKPIIQKIKR